MERALIRDGIAAALIALFTLGSASLGAQSAPEVQNLPADDARGGADRTADAHEHGGHGAPAVGQTSDPAALPPDLAPVTDADRRAAFPNVAGHAVHDRSTNFLVLFDQLEGQTGAKGLSLDAKGWVGGDINRLWFRAEGDTERTRVDTSEAHVLYGRAIARWWELVAGMREDFSPGGAETWAAVGVQGLAPYWFDIEATAYVGRSARTHFRFEAEYDVLLTNRLILQPLVELEVYGKAIPDKDISAGVNSLEPGVRLRYEFRRDLAPYVGVVWPNRFGDAARREQASGARFVAGVRTFF